MGELRKFEDEDVEVRKREVERVLKEIDSPPAWFLEALADFLLVDVLRDKTVNKSARLEYPFLSTTQEIRRAKREISVDTSAVLENVRVDPDLSEVIRAVEPYVKHTKPMSAIVEDKQLRRLRRKRMGERDGDDVKWAISVKMRDEYTCQNPYCDRTDDEMHAHHLYSYKNYPHLRTDIDNGITLCSSCHNRFHKEYGLSNNTKEQFDEWILSQSSDIY